MRKLINESGIDLASNFDNRPFIDVFLEPTKLYVKPVLALKKEVSIKAMNHITGGGFMKIFHVHCQPDMLLELILHHFQRQKYLIGYNSKAILTQMKCITFLIWVLAIQLSLMKKMHHAH